MLAARHWDVTNLTKPIRPLCTPVSCLVAIAALAGCAQAPPRSQGITAEALITSPTPAPVASATAATSTGAAGDASAAANEAVVQKIDPPAFTDHSFVSPLPPDLFIRLRAGFKLQDVDQPAVDRELNWYANHPDYLERTWGRAEHYLHYIVEQLEARGMPLEFALLPVVESAFEPFAYSRARAAGLWQFIPGTGSTLRPEAGLVVRRPPRRRRLDARGARLPAGAARSIRWRLAAGHRRLQLRRRQRSQRAIDCNRAHGKPSDFWHLKLPTETRAYVPKLLAMRRLVAEPERYGLDFSQIPNEPYFARSRPAARSICRSRPRSRASATKSCTRSIPAFNRWATDPEGPHRLLVPIDGRWPSSRRS